MRQKNLTFFALLISAMLLFPISSLFAHVTVGFVSADFPYNTPNQVITVNVNASVDIQAFDLIALVTEGATQAFGTVTSITLDPAFTFPGSDITRVGGAPDDMIRMWAFDPANTMQMPAGDYTFQIEVTTNCDTGLFTVDCTNGWVVDPNIPVIADTKFSLPGGTADTYACTGETYRVFNTAPVITNCPAGQIFNACAVIMYPFAAFDPDNWCVTDLVWSIVGGSAGGSINTVTGDYLWDPVEQANMCKMYDLVVRVTDEWGTYHECTWYITLETAPPIFTDCPTPGSELFIYWGWTADGQVIATDPDACPLPLVYAVVTPPAVGTFNLNTSNGVWDWPTVHGDDTYLGDFPVTISVWDGCEYAYCNFVIRVMPTYEVQIEKIHKQFQGHYAYVDILLNHWTEGFGGFDLLVAYDASALTFMSAAPGDVLVACGFEYFTYSTGAQGNCGGPCPSGFVRIVTIADYNNGPNHPLCFGEGLTGSLATLKFLVTNDHTYEGQFVPISFYWFDCGDNTFSSITGDTLFLSAHVYGYDLVGELTGIPGWGGWQGTGIDCMLGDKVTPDTVVNFYNGGVDIADHDSIDATGDLNLDGLANTIADAVLYTNYFLYGISVFHVALEGQIAASDVNNDGLVLTVGDLVYLIRIIVGDDLPYAKLAPFASTADIKVVNGTVSTSSSEDIGGLYLTFEVNGAYTLNSHTDMEVLYNERDGVLHVLVYSGTVNLTNALPAGLNEVVTVTGADLATVQVSDYYGNLMETHVEKTALPDNFMLSQNVPNPFNPTTKIGIDLPVVTDWTLDIYNVNGQLIKSYNGTNAGHVEVTWDASNVASGVYFYRLTAAGLFTDTKKMVLMK
ncbi:MAG: T9SS type A sorting domain-containing protein [candidate division Zixibacteria bacterium]|nr:T9SS type A sorting domain-containing protein [candidate division Zixibacteria bacterium]